MHDLFNKRLDGFNQQQLRQMSKQQRSISKVITSFKILGGLVFLGINGFLIYHYSTAHEDGVKRGQILQKKKELSKKQGKQKTVAVVPEQAQPEYVQKQVRKYKQAMAAEKKIINKVQ